MSNKTELLNKIKALAEAGSGGEREQAQRILEKLMRKYDIKDSDLSDNTIDEITVFKFHGHDEEILIAQIIYKVTNRRDLYYIKNIATGRKQKTVIRAYCTPAQKIEIEFLFDFYVELWKKEKEFFLKTFIQKHRLFGNLKCDNSQSELSDSEILKMRQLMNSMDDDSPILRLET